MTKELKAASRSSPAPGAISAAASRSRLRMAARRSWSMRARTWRRPRRSQARSSGRGGKALAVTADVADAAAVQAMVAAAAARFGRIDILVNNAAVRAEQAFETMTLADWRAVTAVILDGAFNCVQGLPALAQAERRGRDREYRRPERAYRRGAPPACGDGQGRADRLHPRAGARARAPTRSASTR